MRARATENQCWVVASGQYGVEPKSGIAFVGRSMIVDPWGQIVALAPEGPGVALAEIDLDRVRWCRQAIPVADHRRL